MRKKRIVGIVGLMLAVAFAYFATELRKSAPLLTIVETSFPGCQTRTYTISQNHLQLSRGTRTLAPAVCSRALLRAATDPALATLDPLYGDPRTEDGFELAFHFNEQGGARTLTVRNCYVPSLYRILKECNKLLPPEGQFRQKEHFAWMNAQLQQKIAQYREKTDIPEEFRAKAIADLESQIVTLED